MPVCEGGKEIVEMAILAANFEMKCKSRYLISLAMKLTESVKTCVCCCYQRKLITSKEGLSIY